MSAQPPATLHLHVRHWEVMRIQVEQHAPLEACGLVAGKEGVSLAVFPVENALKSPVRFRMDPIQQLDAFHAIDDQEWELLAIYHSHPQGPAHPSFTDIAEAAYPDVVNLIWWREGKQWHCRGYLIQGQQVSEVPFKVIPEE